MENCHLCKEQTREAETYRIVSPTNSERLLCSECMADLNEAIDNGDLEDNFKLKRWDKKSPPELSVFVENPRDIFLFEDSIIGKRVFNNLKIHSVERELKHFYNPNGVYNYNKYSFPTEKATVYQIRLELIKANQP